MLGIEVKRDQAAGTVHLSQQAYKDSILQRFNFADLKPLFTPMDVQAKLMSEQAPASAAEFAAMQDIQYLTARQSARSIGQRLRLDLTSCLLCPPWHALLQSPGLCIEKL